MVFQENCAYLTITLLTIWLLIRSKKSKYNVIYFFLACLFFLTFVFRPIIFRYYNVEMEFKGGIVNSNISLIISTYVIVFLIIFVSYFELLYINSYSRFDYNSSYSQRLIMSIFIFFCCSLFLVVLLMINPQSIFLTIGGSVLLATSIICWESTSINYLFKYLIIAISILLLGFIGRTFPVLLILSLWYSSKKRISIKKIIFSCLIIIFVICIVLVLEFNRQFSSGAKFNIPQPNNLWDALAMLSYSFSFYDAFKALIILDVQPTFGLDFLESFLVCFPRELFPYKPVVYGTELYVTELVFGMQGSTFVPSMVGVSFLWFGYAGCILGPIVVLYFIIIFTRFLELFKSPGIKCLLAILVSFKLFRSGFDWLPIYIFFVFLPILTIDKLILINNKKSYVSS